MNAPRIACLVAALFIAAPVGLRAQQEPPVAPGDRVRVTAPSLGVEGLVCILQSARPDGIAVDRGPRWLPLDSVTKLEVSRRKSGRILKTALISSAVGAGLGFAINTVACSDEYACEDAKSELYLRSVVGGAAVGFLVGAVIGELSTPQRWEAVPLDRIRIGLTPHSRPGLTVSVSMRL